MALLGVSNPPSTHGLSRLVTALSLPRRTCSPSATSSPLRSALCVGRSLRRSRVARVVAEVSVELGGAKGGQSKAAIGDRVKVTSDVVVFHVPKAPTFSLEGKEGEVKDVLGVWKGKEVSANLPFKVQFVVDVNGSATKFFAHLKDDEFEVL